MGEPYNVLVGVGFLYLAPAHTAKPALDEDPGEDWALAGETDGGVKVRKTQNIEAFSSDQRTGNIKAVRTEEGVEVETNIQENTLEYLANVINGTVTATPADTDTIGTRSLSLHAGAEVTEYALLFRGKSPYGNFPGQYYVPRGYIGEDVETEYTKDGKTLIPVKFMALEDLTAEEEVDRFGVVEYQDAEATGP